MEFSKQFIEIFDALAERVGIVIDWGSKNVLPYLQDLGGRIVNYEIYTSVAWIVFGVIILILGLICLYTFSTKDSSYDNVTETFLALGFLFMIPIGIVMIGTQAFDIIEAVTIPEKTIYDLIQKVM